MRENYDCAVKARPFSLGSDISHHANTLRCAAAGRVNVKRRMETLNMGKFVNSVSVAALMALAPLALPSAALANDKLLEMSKSDDNWLMPGKNYDSDNYSGLTQINDKNVKNLKVSWQFSTGLLNGHEGAPLVVNGKMYVHTSFRTTPSPSARRSGQDHLAGQAEAEPGRALGGLLRSRQPRLAYWPATARPRP